MNKMKLALVATVGLLVFACKGKTDVDFSIVPVKGPNGEYQYIDVSQKGKIVINPQFSEAYIFRDGLALVKTSGRDGKYGYINKKGKYAIAPTYDYAQDFGDKVAWVQLENQPPMLIDQKGKMLMQIDSLVEAKPFNNGIATVSYYSEGNILAMFIDKKGKPAATTAVGDRVIPIINDGLYAFKSKGSEKWGYRNTKGEIVINEQFDGADAFFEGVAVVKVGNKYGSIDKKGNFIVNPQYDHLSYDSDGLFIAKMGNKFGWVNKKGEIAINPQFDDYWPFYGNKLAPVKMGSKGGYIDREGQVVINPQFDEALPFFGDYAPIVNKGFGFINKKGELVVPPQYNWKNDDAREYIYAVGQKKFGLSIWYYFNVSDEDEEFLPYDRLKEKMQDYAIKKAEEEKVAAEAAIKELLASIESNPSPAIAELEEEAKKWQNEHDYKSNEGKFFSFKKTTGTNQDGNEINTWTATSKIKMGDCPEKSVWKMIMECGEDFCSSDKKIPAKCETITPKIIVDYNDEKNYGEAY